MKRFKSLISLLLCVVMTLQITGLTNAFGSGSSSDYENHWAKTQIDRLLDENIVSGYSDNSVKPDNNISRAEFITLINKSLNYSSKADFNFQDVSANAWYADQFLIAKEAGYLTGDDMGNANPVNYITRAEVCVIVSQVLGLEENDETDFSDDASLASWAKPYIGAMADKGLISGYPDGSFGAKKNITRAESFVIICNMLDAADTDDTDTDSSVSDNEDSSDDEESEETTAADETTETTTVRRSSGGGGGGSSRGSSSNTTTTTEATTEAATETTTETDYSSNYAFLEESNEAELFNFQADQYDISVGSTAEVLFTVQVYTDEVLGDTDIYVSDSSGNIVVYLNDQGSGGDAAANDGIFSAAASLSSDVRQNITYSAKYNDIESNNITIGYYETYTEEDENLVLSVQNGVNSAQTGYLNDEGYVADENVEALTAAVSQYLDSQVEAGTVTRYSVGDDSIIIVLSNGIKCFYSIPIEGSDSSGSNVSIATYQPCLDTYGTSTANKTTECVDGSASDIADKFDTYTFTTNLNTQAVTVPVLEQIDDNGVVLWHGHGGYDADTVESDGSFVITGVDYTQNNFITAYSGDISANRILIGFGVEDTSGRFMPRAAVTGGFFQKYLGDMTGAYVYLAACSSAKDMRANGSYKYKLAQSFLDKGAAAVIGNSGTIKTIYNVNMLNSVNSHLQEVSSSTGNYKTLSEALDEAKADNGSTDANGSYPIICGGSSAENYRLANVEEGYIAGTVTDGTTNEYIEGALVRIYYNGILQKSVTTDSSGYYNTDLAPGEYVVKISAGNYESVKILVNVDADVTTYNETVLMNEVSLINSGTAVGTVSSALTGLAVSDAQLVLRKGWNNYSGTEILTASTASSGEYQIECEPGIYTLEVSKDGYSTAYKNIVILNVDILTQNILLTPNVSEAEGEYRIVLSWTGEPDDLDLHMTGPACDGSDSRFHLYFPSSIAYNNGSYVLRDYPTYCDDNVSLDIDDMDYEGPETITIYKMMSGVYRISVLDYTNKWASSSDVLSQSGAQVTIYKGDSLLAVFNVPTNVEGTLWTVCELDGDTITPINKMSYGGYSGSADFASQDGSEASEYEYSKTEDEFSVSAAKSGLFAASDESDDEELTEAEDEEAENIISGDLSDGKAVIFEETEDVSEEAESSESEEAEIPAETVNEADKE